MQRRVLKEIKCILCSLYFLRKVPLIWFVNKICKLAKWPKCISNEFDLFSKYEIIIIHYIIINIDVSFINIYITQFNTNTLSVISKLEKIL